jgi:hypothetical protein
MDDSCETSFIALWCACEGRAVGRHRAMEGGFVVVRERVKDEEVRARQLSKTLARTHVGTNSSSSHEIMRGDRLSMALQRQASCYPRP